MSRTITSFGRTLVSAIRSEGPLAGPSVVKRGISSIGAEPIKVETTYPFNSKVVFPPSPNPKPIPPRLLSPKNGWSVVRAHDEAARRRLDPQNLCGTLFSRRHRDRVRPGSILTVTSYNDSSKTSTNSFSGVLMGISRSGSDYSIRLRNIVNRVGVEIQFKILSPMVKEIKVVRKAGNSSAAGQIKALRQAQAYFLRDRPDMLKGLAGAMKSDQMRKDDGKKKKGN